MPAYTYFEAHTGLPIGRALAQLLISGEGRKVQGSTVVQAIENLTEIQGGSSRGDLIQARRL